MTGEKSMQITERELAREKEQAVIESKVDDIETMIPEIWSSLKSLDKAVSSIPMQIVSCRDEIEKEMRGYSHEQFITDRELNRFETKLEAKLSAQIFGIRGTINKASWILTGFITAATFFNYIVSHTEVLTK